MEGQQRKQRRSNTALELALSLEGYAGTCRTTMHRVASAAAESSSGETSQGVSLAALAYSDVHWDARVARCYLNCANIRLPCTALASTWKVLGLSVSRNRHQVTNFPRGGLEVLKWRPRPPASCYTIFIIAS
jgi:hypothetical protein